MYIKLLTYKRVSVIDHFLYVVKTNRILGRLYILGKDF